MPIYEFYCKDCHTIFNFFSVTVNTEKIPLCPRCKKRKLKRQLSTFSTLKGGKEEDEAGLPDIDESKMEKAMGMLAQEADRIDENDPRQAANLMRKLTDMTGLNLGPGMEEALRRMEAGEDPEQIEEQMGDLLEEEEPFMPGEKKPRRAKTKTPKRDETLYYL